MVMTKCSKCMDTTKVWATAMNAYMDCECRVAKLRTRFFAPLPKGEAFITKPFYDLKPMQNSVHILTNGMREGYGLVRGLLAVKYHSDLTVNHCTIRELAEASTHAGNEDDPLSGNDGRIRRCDLLIVSLDSPVKSEAYNSILSSYLKDRMRYDRATLVLQTCPGTLVDALNQTKVLIDEMTGWPPIREPE
jgi:hypothetical protein